MGTFVRLKMGILLVLILSIIINDTCGQRRRSSTYTSRARSSCYIPHGALYERSVYRYMYGNDWRNIQARTRINTGTYIRVFCTKDRYHDAIVDYTNSRCWKGSWIPALPKCINYKRCDNDILVSETIASETADKGRTFPHGKEVIYKCNDRSILIGQETRSCYNGTWSTINFECQTKSDIHLDMCMNMTVMNGNAEVTNMDNYPLDMTIKCSHGYSLNMATVFQCQNGSWIDGTPVCNPVPCPPISVKYVINKSTNERDTQLVHRTSITFWCQRRAKPNVNPSTVTCNAGIWEPRAPACKAYCLLPLPNQTKAIFQYTATKEQAHGRIYHRTKVQQTCRMMTKTRVIKSTCIKGRWTPKFKRCITIRARSISLLNKCMLSNGTSAIHIDMHTEKEIVTDDVEHGTNISTSCSYGPVAEPLLHENTSVCLNGTWVPELTTCPAIKPCYSSDLPIQNIVFVPILEQYYFNDIIHVSGCRDPDIQPIGSHQLKCLHSGTWEGNVKCREEKPKCGQPNIQNGIYEPNQDEYNTDDVIHVTGCQNDSQSLVGADTIQCLENGMWNGSVKCISYCEYGVELIKKTKYTYALQTEMQVKRLIKPNADQCFAACLELNEFFCQSIEITKRRSKASIGCNLLSDHVNEHPDRFIATDNNTYFTVYGRFCDDRCSLPEIPVNVTITDGRGLEMVARQRAESGSVVKVVFPDTGCEDRYMTCLGGIWDSDINQPCEYSDITV